jgi:hypothetical protein
MFGGTEDNHLKSHFNAGGKPAEVQKGFFQNKSLERYHDTTLLDFAVFYIDRVYVLFY